MKFIKLFFLRLSLILGIFFLLKTGQLFGQISIKKKITLLSDDTLYGRGTYKDGHIKAATLITTWLKNIGESNIIQPFPVITNRIQTFECSFFSNGNKVPIDCYPHPASPSILATFNLTSLTANNFKSQIAVSDTLFLKNSINTNNQITLINRKYQAHSYSQVQHQSVQLHINQQDNKVPAETLIAIDSLNLIIDAKIDTITAYNILSKPPMVKKKKKINVLLMAHYDHLGALNDEIIFNGANDNASGVAFVFNLLEKRSILEKQNITLQFAFWSGEEMGLLGSNYAYSHNLISVYKPDFILNFDMVASGNGSFGVVGAKDFPNAFTLLKTRADSLNIPLKARANAPNGDHYFFLKAGISGFYIYSDKGTQPYHHPGDKPSTLDYEQMEQLEMLILSFLANLSASIKN